MELRSKNLVGGYGQFYVDTGAEISIIREHRVTLATPIDREHIVSISGVTDGVSHTLGIIETELHGLQCTLHIVSDDFPISTDGLFGWDI